MQYASTDAFDIGHGLLSWMWCKDISLLTCTDIFDFDILNETCENERAVVVISQST